MIPDVPGRPLTDAAASQGRADGTAAVPRNLDGPRLSVGDTAGRQQQVIDFAHLKRVVPLASVLEHYGVLTTLRRSG